MFVNLGDKYATAGGVSSQPFGTKRHHEAANAKKPTPNAAQTNGQAL
jgi:hypothetical protein